MKNKFIPLLFLMLIFIVPEKAYASEYITIYIEAEDDSGEMKYALDTDDPAAFTELNEFEILAGTTHTLYVMDAAGNITSQTYNANTSEDESAINIELEINDSDNRENSNNVSNNTANSYYGYGQIDAEPNPGSGTVYEKTYTDGSENSEKIFYTITTKEGEVLYLIVDQRRASDNVYLLDTVSAADLMSLADDAVATANAAKEDNLLSALSKDNRQSEDGDADSRTTVSSQEPSGNNMIIIFVCIAAVGVIYYYFKIYKPKKDEEMDAVDDAMDLDEFEPASEEDEIEFDPFSDEEKDEFIENLVNSDDEDLYDADPEEYAAEEDAESGFVSEDGDYNNYISEMEDEEEN